MTKNQIKRQYSRNAKIRRGIQADNDRESNAIGWAFALSFLLGCIIFVTIN